MKRCNRQEDGQEEKDDLTREDFDKELASLKSKGKSIYNDLIKSGMDSSRMYLNS